MIGHGLAHVTFGGWLWPFSITGPDFSGQLGVAVISASAFASEKRAGFTAIRASASSAAWGWLWNHPGQPGRQFNVDLLVPFGKYPGH